VGSIGEESDSGVAVMLLLDVFELVFKPMSKLRSESRSSERREGSEGVQASHSIVSAEAFSSGCVTADRFTLAWNAASSSGSCQKTSLVELS